MVLKTVTLQEANGLLPLVRERFVRIHFLLSHIQELKSISPKDQNCVLKLNRRAKNIRLIERKTSKKENKKQFREIKQIESLIDYEMNELMKLGAVVKGLFPPHIDFLSMLNNQPIFLCWHGNEKEITHWHHLDDSSPLRHTIAKKQCFGPMMVH